MLFFHTINSGVRECSNRRDGVLVDVRLREEYLKDGHIPMSVNVPLAELNSCKIPKMKHLYVYCRTGARSRIAARILKRMGYLYVKNIGGINKYKGPLDYSEVER